MGFYVTTFCNFAHNTKTGAPIKHECYTLDPRALALEMEGKFDEVNQSGGMKKGCFFAGKRLKKQEEAEVDFSAVLNGVPKI